jgi:hypothetical protein
MMRTAICLLMLLAACELEPAPKAKPTAGSGSAAAGSAAPAPAPTPTPPPTPSPAPPPPLVDACTDAAVRYVEIGIENAKDPQLRQSLEIERARTVLRIETGCRAQKWSTEITDCYKAAKTPADLQVCTKKLQPVPAGPAPKADQPLLPAKDQPTPADAKGAKPDAKKPDAKKPDAKKPADAKTPKPDAKKPDAKKQP